ncbi:hypothetical protein IGI39_003644 [Enterococcus sp. AZ135]|uniref:hypothetical protein n=1 Tax=unclassified Enterococcus TaxID=2608891 RepID=UPI003F240584
MNTDFENESIEIMKHAGISMKYIQKQKRTILQDAHVEEYYDLLENSEVRWDKIPTDKIIAIKTDWATAGKSVYDLFMGKVGEADAQKKIAENVNSLKAHGLDFQRAFYSGESNLEGNERIKFNYYREDDCYIIQNDGFDRMISAKMFGAPFMSGTVTTYVLNEEKKKLYDEYESLQEILRLTDLKGLTMDLLAKEDNADDK